MLLILTLAMGFTGYLLPFDQQSYWATIVGVNINGTARSSAPLKSSGSNFRSSTRTFILICRTG